MVYRLYLTIPVSEEEIQKEIDADYAGLGIELIQVAGDVVLVKTPEDLDPALLGLLQGETFEVSNVEEIPEEELIMSEKKISLSMSKNEFRQLRGEMTLEGLGEVKCFGENAEGLKVLLTFGEANTDKVSKVLETYGLTSEQITTAIKKEAEGDSEPDKDDKKKYDKDGKEDPNGKYDKDGNEIKEGENPTIDNPEGGKIATSGTAVDIEESVIPETMSFVIPGTKIVAESEKHEIVLRRKTAPKS